MGRLRNLSESFKAAAFPFSHSEPSVSAPALVKTDSQQSANDTIAKELPVAERERSNTSLQQQPPPLVDLPVRTPSRPNSTLYPSPMMDRDNHIEELVPVFTYLSSHANKLYQEGYFLKLNDLDTYGKPTADRNWTECFAQLVGTVLSLWDAAALDAAGQDGEVAPTFINLADASIKMIETLPTRNKDVQPLQNVLSISTAGKNRYLLHFNSLHSLTQWTAGIRLAMFEHASLQELYTGSLIAGKGKRLNNIRTIMEKTKFKTEDWARVRFGAGTPWRRCWYVIEPPDEKEWQRATKSLKKRSAYDRPAYPKGDIKFYDTKKIKKATPIATITDAYSAYAIYPQSKPLIDQSTLIKVEGQITIHSNPESRTEGFVFVMPEVHPAVSGFEMMLRWLFPLYDCFHLYGRPNRLIADTLDVRGLMFAMPKERRYGYLDIIDVAAMIHTDGSERWSEREWRKQMKDFTSRRIVTSTQNRPSGTFGSHRVRSSTDTRSGITYDDMSVRSTPPSRQGQVPNQSTDAVFATPGRVATAPANAPHMASGHHLHKRSVSESVTASPTKNRRPYKPSRLSMDQEAAEEMEARPIPPAHRQLYRPNQPVEAELMDSRDSSDSELQLQRTRSQAEGVHQDLREQSPPAPVAAPPDFHHHAGDRPQRAPDTRPDMRRKESRLSNSTLDQLVDASKMNGNAAGIAATAAWKTGGTTAVNEPSNDRELSANQGPGTVLMADGARSQRQPDQRPPELRQTSAHSISRKPLPNSSNELNNVQAPKLPIPPSVTNISNQEHLYRERRSASRGQNNILDQSAIDTNPPRPQSTPIDRNKPRTGVLKTVGDSSPRNPRVDIPVVDFGVTRSLTPETRSSSAMGTLGRNSPNESPATPERRLPYEQRTPSRLTPEGIRSSLFGRGSPSPAHSRSSSYGRLPASTTSPRSPGPPLSAEEYVQQKYEASRVPSGVARPKQPLSPKSDQPPKSPNKLQKKRDSRPNSTASFADMGSNLSAREQEHVARVTGGPLVNLPSRNRTPDPSIGLIGAIEAREQERRNVREGVSGQMVQEAIAQRQFHDQAQIQAMSQPQQSAYAQQHSNNLPNDPWANRPNMGFYALSQQHQQRHQQTLQQQWQTQQYQNQQHQPQAQPDWQARQWQQSYGGYYQ